MSKRAYTERHEILQGFGNMKYETICCLGDNFSYIYCSLLQGIHVHLDPSDHLGPVFHPFKRSAFRYFHSFLGHNISMDEPMIDTEVDRLLSKTLFLRETLDVCQNSYHQRHLQLQIFSCSIHSLRTTEHALQQYRCGTLKRILPTNHQLKFEHLNRRRPVQHDQNI